MDLKVLRFYELLGVLVVQRLYGLKTSFFASQSKIVEKFYFLLSKTCPQIVILMTIDCFKIK